MPSVSVFSRKLYYTFIRLSISLSIQTIASVKNKRKVKKKWENMDDDIGLENIFEDSYLDTLSLEQLTVLN